MIVPIYKGADQKAGIDAKVEGIVKELKALGIRVKYDDNDNNRPGWKFAEYEMKGVPVRIAIGARDIENNVAEIARRDTKTKASQSLDGLAQHIHQLLEEIQDAMYKKALEYRDSHITKADSWDEFEKLLDKRRVHLRTLGWYRRNGSRDQGTHESHDPLHPLNNPQEAGACILTGKPSKERVLFARAY